MKYGGGMNELPYPSDLTAAQWALIERLLPAPKPKGRKRRVDLRKITNAILYVLKGVGACCRVNLLLEDRVPLLSSLAARRAVGPPESAFRMPTAWRHRRSTSGGAPDQNQVHVVRELEL